MPDISLTAAMWHEPTSSILVRACVCSHHPIPSNCDHCCFQTRRSRPITKFCWARFRHCSLPTLSLPQQNFPAATSLRLLSRLCLIYMCCAGLPRQLASWQGNVGGGTLSRIMHKTLAHMFFSVIRLALQVYTSAVEFIKKKKPGLEKVDSPCIGTLCSLQSR